MSTTTSNDFPDPTRRTIASLVLEQSKMLTTRVAIDFIGGSKWTYNDCKKHALVAAAELKAVGVKTGDNVAVMIDSPEDFCRYWLGLNFTGAAMIAINTSMRGAPLKHQLEISDCSLVVADKNNIDECRNTGCDATMITVAELARLAVTELPLEEITTGSSDDLSCVMFTSGTSGPSKGVLMPQAHCMLFAVGTIENYELSANDVFYICLPLFHANGLFMQLLACLTVGCKAVVREKFSATRWLEDIRQYKITHTNTLGAVAAFIVAQPATSKDRDHCLKVIGAAPLPAAAEEIFRDRFCVPSVVPLYGMTEVNIPLYGKLNESAPGTCGYCYEKHFDVEIRHPETDEALADGVTGEIMVRPKTANGFMSGYIGMPEQTLQSFRSRWFCTGDAGYRNDRRQFVFVDRIKDCIRKRGENISSYEVEQAFLAIDEIAEVAAYAVPADAVHGVESDGMEDEVMIAVLLKQGAQADIDHWIDSAAKDLPVFASPRYVRIVDELPKTQTGKIRKVVLREEGITEDTTDRAV